VQNPIAVIDYDGDSALKEGLQEPRSTPEYLSREDLIEFYGTLGIDGLEITDFYWQDCSPSYIKRLAADRGLPIVCYLFEADLTLSSERQASLDSAFLHLDRTP